MERWTALEERVQSSGDFSRPAREVLRSFSSSFFLVTRFSPAAKRPEVEMIYAAVRYPDEIVDSFPLPPAAKYGMLAKWGADYERALKGY